MGPQGWQNDFQRIGWKEEEEERKKQGRKLSLPRSVYFLILEVDIDDHHHLPALAYLNWKLSVKAG